jgi:hypothetical protein
MTVIESITIQREPNYSIKEEDRAFIAVIAIKNLYGDMRLRLDRDKTNAIITVISDLIVDSGKETASMLVEQAMKSATLLEAPVVVGKIDADEDIPF